MPNMGKDKTEAKEVGETAPMVTLTESTEKKHTTQNRHEEEDRGCCIATPWRDCFPCILSSCQETDDTTVSYM